MTEEIPRISVVICFLNASRFIAETLESVAAQTFRDYEVILVDDGSTDDSQSIAQEWTRRDLRFRYVEHEGHINLGLSASRNVGIRLARAEFIALLDADDVWVPEKLEEQLALMERDESLAMVCGGVRYWESWAGGKDVITPTGGTPGKRNPPEATLQFYPLGAGPAPCPSDLLLRRQHVLAVGGFEEEYRGAKAMYEDQAFLAKLYLSAPILVSEKVWLSYRIHGASIVANVMREGRYHEVRGYFLAWLRRYLDEKGIGEGAVRRRLAWVMLWDRPLIARARGLFRRVSSGIARRWKRLFRTA
jgi:glycosyltransferase involved in cell wall biosynthesis